MLQPTLKQIAVHRAAKRKWSYDFMAILCRNNTGSGKMPASKIA